MEEKQKLIKEYTKKSHSIDMTRGKPCSEQLDFSMPLLDEINSKANLMSSEGIDCRNYGVFDGLSECKKLMASLIGLEEKDVIVFGNSSLNIMYKCITNSFLYGVCGLTPWSKLEKIKWLCPVPGYDRHFAICEHLGIEMINIPMTEYGPDMDMVEEFVKDPFVKGIWCAPQYSNPTGITYSDEVVKRFSKLKPSAKDFRIYWDNAYCVHHLYKERQDHLLNLVLEARKNNNEDIVYEFVSTSKISFPGSGVAAVAASKRNLDDIRSHLKVQTIGYDKINQLRHVRYFKDIHGIQKQMQKHAEILRPKFELVDAILTKELSGIAKWTKPNGGYFISLYVDGKAKQIIDRCKECGVKLTDFGCAYPYHNDSTNSHIRLAPSFLNMDELEIATKVICLATKIELSKDKEE